MKGKIDDKGNAPSKNFDIEIKDAETKKVTKAVVDTNTGEYAAVVNSKVKHDLIVTVKKDNYAFSSAMIMKDSVKNSKPIKMNITTDTIKPNSVYIIRNLYYETNSAVLNPRCMIVVDEFVDFLKTHPNLKIEIHGHTDNVGNDKANLALSTDRAFTVRDLLLAKKRNR